VKSGWFGVNAWRGAAILACTIAAGTASAGYNATATGTVNFIQQMSPSMGTAETFLFAISGQPTVTCGSGFHYFIVSPNSITDPQTRKNMLAILMLAKGTAATVVVGYDSATAPGNSCDQGYPVVYWLETQ
jgi:hypothetical protein